MSPLIPLIERAAAALRDSQRLVVFTGAGVSKESGIPTFRDALEGLWAKYDPQQLATPEAFRQNPKLVWDWYTFRRGLLAGAEPNPGHYALAQFEDRLPQVVVITQNIDGFHQLVGSSDVIELHGNLARNKCFANCQGEPTLVNVDKLAWDKESGPPKCPYCNTAYVRPDVVWYHEMLPEAALKRAIQLSTVADVMLVVGTSGIVYPANQLPVFAKRNGATVIDVNPDVSQISGFADIFIPGPSGEILPQILAAMDADASSGEDV
ncbi:MAG: NAD-dependent deacylase [Anaerolineae bacterium]|nr:NAD-dependent deacylase [Anaerolineae bacterium]